MELLQTVWDFISGYLSTGNLLTGLAFIVGLIAAKTGLDFVNEIRDVVDTYKEAKHPDSPGGEDVTDGEQQEIEKQFSEAVEAIWDRYRDTLFDLFGRLFGKVRFW